jgi:hypothetical protein
MQSYLINKTISVLLPFLIVFATFLKFGSHADQWTLLLMIVFTLGYTHYFIGGFYQLRGFFRQPKPFRFIVAFLLCVLLSAVIIWSAHYYAYMWLIAFLAIPYFMIHGYDNEVTLFARSSRGVVPRRLLLSLSLFVTGFTLLAFTHPSAYWGYDLSFMSPFEIAFQKSAQSVFIVFADTLALGLLVLGVGVAFYASKQSAPYQSLGRILLGVELFALVFLVYSRPNYVYLFFMLLAYHFITCALFYGQQFYHYSKPVFIRYCVAHLTIVLAAVFGYWWFVVLEIQNPSAFVFNGNIFLFLTMVHITTSFLNDTWCKECILGIGQRS